MTEPKQHNIPNGDPEAERINHLLATNPDPGITGDYSNMEQKVSAVIQGGAHLSEQIYAAIMRGYYNFNSGDPMDVLRDWEAEMGTLEGYFEQ